MDSSTYKSGELALYIPGFDVFYLPELGIDGARIMIHPEGKHFSNMGHWVKIVMAR